MPVLPPGTEGSGTPAPDPAPDHAGLLAELASLVRQIAANSDRNISEAVEWLRQRGI